MPKDRFPTGQRRTQRPHLTQRAASTPRRNQRLPKGSPEKGSHEGALDEGPVRGPVLDLLDKLGQGFLRRHEFFISIGNMLAHGRRTICHHGKMGSEGKVLPLFLQGIVNTLKSRTETRSTCGYSKKIRGPGKRETFQRVCHKVRCIPKIDGKDDSHNRIPILYRALFQGVKGKVQGCCQLGGNKIGIASPCKVMNHGSSPSRCRRMGRGRPVSLMDT